jgi:hypothetical protein
MAMATRTLALGVAIGTWILFASSASGQFSGGGGGRHGGGGKGSASGPSNPARNIASPTPQIVRTPHGGEYLVSEKNQYEIVYMPLQTRIYLFDSERKPLSARNVHAQMSLKLPSESAPRRIPFGYAAMPAGTAEQDYVVAVFDNRQLKDDETPITFEFSGLADRSNAASSFTSLFKSGSDDKTTIAFTPLFSPSKIRPYVARVLPTEADRDGVMRQKVCPVSGQTLGVAGSVVKVYIADYPLYLSGEDCIAAVKEAPEKYLPQPVAPIPGR